MKLQLALLIFIVFFFEGCLTNQNKDIFIYEIHNDRFKYDSLIDFKSSIKLYFQEYGIGYNQKDIEIIHNDRNNDNLLIEILNTNNHVWHIENNKQDIFVEKLSNSISSVARSIYPKPIVVRFSDFKTNEYKLLKSHRLL